jgi:hypothetical protein
MGNNSITKFTAEVKESIDYYVYRLIDPRNGQTFYVGMGQNNRVFDHINAAKKSVEKSNNQKLKRIRDIHAAGLDVIHIIHRHGIKSEETAREVEGALLDMIPGLTNEQGGYGSAERGPASPQEIDATYRKREIIREIKDKVLIIKVNRSTLADKSSVYEAVRSAWVVSIHKAAQAEYVLACVDGVVEGVYENIKWTDSVIEPSRKEFTADETNNSKYYDKRIDKELLGQANPIRYTF